MTGDLESECKKTRQANASNLSRKCPTRIAEFFIYYQRHMDKPDLPTLLSAARLLADYSARTVKFSDNCAKVIALHDVHKIFLSNWLLSRSGANQPRQRNSPRARAWRVA